MLRVATFRGLLLVFVLSTWDGASLYGAKPSASLLPDTTRGYLSIPSMDQLGQKWEQTQLGQLANDPVMKPFAEDVRRQIRDKLGQTSARLGLTWEDIVGVQSGEVCAAMIQPEGDETKYAAALIVDVTGRDEAMTSLLEKIDAAMQERKATKRTNAAGGTVITSYTIPPQKENGPEVTVYLFVKDGQLVVVNHEDEANAILARFEGDVQNVLAASSAFQQVMGRCNEALGKTEPQIRWFVEPLAYAQVVRAVAGGPRRRGKDRIKIFAEQGFDAVQGVGGCVSLATGKHELLHRTFVYAPGVKRADGDPNQDKYNLAFRMFDFPNHVGLGAQEWIPRELATYGTFNWKMADAFEYSSTLVDAILGEGFFEDFLASLHEDINGPQIDIRKELVAHLGQRATFVSDNLLPITPQSERLMVALEVTDAGAVSANLDRALKNDPYARKLEIEGHTIWEMLNDEEEELPAVVIDGIGLTPIPGMEDTLPAAVEEEQRILTNQAIAVVHGQLIVTSHVDLMKRIVTPRAGPDSLAESVDYQMVNRALGDLGAGEDSLRFFSRTDEEYRATYELIRQNRMPEAETLAGRLLNRVLGPQEEGVLRQQQIDGEKLPDFQVVRRYLGPAGVCVHSEPDGWMVTGVMLHKDQLYDPALERPAVETASANTDGSNPD